jgi:iron complex transport system permease protein
MTSGRSGVRALSRGRQIVFWLVLVSPVVLVGASLLVGSSGRGLGDVIGAIQAWFAGEATESTMIVLNIRLPRILGGLFVGAALAVSGATLQGVLRNPLVDPYILGISSGAAFGAALSIIALPALPLQLAAFAFGLAAFALSYGMALSNRAVSIVSLVLAGVVTGSVFTALLSILQIMATERSLQSVVLWIMGSLNGFTWSGLRAIWLPILVGVTIVWLLRWRLNVLALGDREAAAVGLPVERYRFIFVLLAALIAAVAVSVAGVVALLGLVIPHIVRMTIGPDHRILIPASAALGGSFLIAVDAMARGLTPFEIPLSIITTLLGAPFFYLLLRTTRTGGWE